MTTAARGGREDLPRATLENWMQAPYGRWGFRNVSELIRTERISRAQDSRALREDPVDLLDRPVLDAEGNAVALRVLLECLEIDGIVALHGRDVRFEWYAPHMHATDRHILFSVSKSVTALLAGALIGAGRLDADGPVEQYVPEIAASGFGGATVRNLLDMTVSLDFVEDYGPEADFVVYGAAGGWGPYPATIDLRGYLASVRPGSAHGQRFSYLSPATDLLGWVCERAAGVSYAEALSRFLWMPMGAQADATVTIDEHGLARAAGGISATLRDVARVGRVVADGGAGIVPATFVADLLSGVTAGQWAVGDFADLFPAGAYRSCWYQPRLGQRALCAIGVHGQYIHVDLDSDAVVAIVSSRSDPASDEADRLALSLAAQIVSAITEAERR